MIPPFLPQLLVMAGQYTETVNGDNANKRGFPRTVKMTKVISSAQTTLSMFDQLPDCGLVRLPVVLGLFPCSRATFWRWVKDGRVPAPKKMGGKISVWSVGELRKTLKAIVENDDIGKSTICAK